MAMKPGHAFMLGGLAATVGLMAAAVSFKRNNDINLVDVLDEKIPNPVFNKKKNVFNDYLEEENDETVKEGVKED